jgi:PAS domain S-box-containing protein
MDEKDIIKGLKAKISRLEKEAGLYRQTLKENEALDHKLSSAQNILASVVDGNPIPTFILDQHHKVLYWNQTLEAISGIRAPDIVGTDGQWRAFYDFKRPVMADLIIDGVDETVFWNHYKHNTEYTSLQKSALKEGAYESQDFFKGFGETGMWLFVTACPLTDEKGRVIGAIETFQDVTRLINAQKESRKNEEKYRVLFENGLEAEKELSRLRNYLSNIINSMPSVLIGIDAEGRVTHWNAKAEQSAGLKADDAVGRNISVVFPRLNDMMEKIKTAIKGKTVLEERKIPHEKDGIISYESLTVYPLLGEEMEGAVIRIDDVTDQVQIEEMMIHSEKMLSVGSLAAGMAHELNNPLAGMMQNAQVMAGRLSGTLPANERAAAEVGVSMDAVRAYMEKREIIHIAELINDSGKRAAKIIRNMLSFARKSQSKKMAYRLSEILDKTIEIAGSDYDLITNYDFKQIEIIRAYDRDVPAVFCDESKIQQVFWNILKNGAEAMQEKKGPARFYLRIYQSGNSVNVEIEDNGPGMDKDIRKRVFEPFFTTKGKEKGTGLGLAVSYFIIVKDHGGKIRIESHKGLGTKFIVQLGI